MCLGCFSFTTSGTSGCFWSSALTGTHELIGQNWSKKMMSILRINITSTRPWATLMQFTMWLADNFLMFMSCPGQSVSHVLNKSLSCLCPTKQHNRLTIWNSIFLPVGLSVRPFVSHNCSYACHPFLSHNNLAMATTLCQAASSSVLFRSAWPSNTKVAQVGKSTSSSRLWGFSMQTKRWR